MQSTATLITSKEYFIKLAVLHWTSLAIHELCTAINTVATVHENFTSQQLKYLNLAECNI